MDAGNVKYPLISCSGALRSEIRLAYKTESITMQAICVSVSGLIGGHSGVEIDKGRVNANILAGRVSLFNLYDMFNFFLF